MVTPLRRFCLDWLDEKAEYLGGDILNVGSRDDHYNYRKMFYNAKTFRNLDIEWNRYLDIVCDAADMHMILDESIDTILAIFMLYNPSDVTPLLDEFKRILKPGGTLLTTYQPFNQPFYINNYESPEVLVTDGGRWKIAGNPIYGNKAQSLIKERFILKDLRKYMENHQNWLFMEATKN